MLKVIDLLTEKETLNMQFGNLSCLAYPKEYNRMDETQTEAKQQLAKELSNVINDISNNITLDSVLSILEDISFEIAHGNIERDNMEIVFYTQDDYVENVVKNNFDDEKDKLFDSLFQHMPSETKASWLNGNHLSHNNNLYSNKWVDFIVEVVEG